MFPPLEEEEEDDDEELLDELLDEELLDDDELEELDELLLEELLLEELLLDELLVLDELPPLDEEEELEEEELEDELLDDELPAPGVTPLVEPLLVWPAPPPQALRTRRKNTANWAERALPLSVLSIYANPLAIYFYVNLHDFPVRATTQSIDD